MVDFRPRSNKKPGANKKRGQKTRATMVVKDLKYASRSRRGPYSFRYSSYSSPIREPAVRMYSYTEGVHWYVSGGACSRTRSRKEAVINAICWLATI